MPEEWEEVHTEEGEVYFYNRQEDRSQHEHPCDTFYREMFNVEKRKEQEEIQKTMQNSLKNHQRPSQTGSKKSSPEKSPHSSGQKSHQLNDVEEWEPSISSSGKRRERDPSNNPFNQPVPRSPVDDHPKPKLSPEQTSQKHQEREDTELERCNSTRSLRSTAQKSGSRSNIYEHSKSKTSKQPSQRTHDGEGSDPETSNSVCSFQSRAPVPGSRSNTVEHSKSAVPPRQIKHQSSQSHGAHGDDSSVCKSDEKQKEDLKREHDQQLGYELEGTERHETYNSSENEAIHGDDEYSVSKSERDGNPSREQGVCSLFETGAAEHQEYHAHNDTQLESPFDKMCLTRTSSMSHRDREGTIAETRSRSAPTRRRPSSSARASLSRTPTGTLHNSSFYSMRDDDLTDNHSSPSNDSSTQLEVLRKEAERLKRQIQRIESEEEEAFKLKDGQKLTEVAELQLSITRLRARHQWLLDRKFNSKDIQTKRETFAATRNAELIATLKKTTEQNGDLLRDKLELEHEVAILKGMLKTMQAQPEPTVTANSDGRLAVLQKYEKLEEDLKVAEQALAKLVQERSTLSNRLTEFESKARQTAEMESRIVQLERALAEAWKTANEEEARRKELEELLVTNVPKLEDELAKHTLETELLQVQEAKAKALMELAESQKIRSEALDKAQEEVDRLLAQAQQQAEAELQAAHQQAGAEQLAAEELRLSAEQTLARVQADLVAVQAEKQQAQAELEEAGRMKAQAEEELREAKLRSEEATHLKEFQSKGIAEAEETKAMMENERYLLQQQKLQVAHQLAEAQRTQGEYEELLQALKATEVQFGSADQIRTEADAKLRVAETMKAQAELLATKQMEASLASDKWRFEREEKVAALQRAHVQHEAELLFIRQQARNKVETDLLTAHQADLEADSRLLSVQRAKAEAELLAKALVKAELLAQKNKTKAESQLTSSQQACARAEAELAAVQRSQGSSELLLAEAQLLASKEKALLEAQAELVGAQQACAEAEAQLVAAQEAKSEAELLVKAQGDAEVLAQKAKSKSEGHLQALRQSREGASAELEVLREQIQAELVGARSQLEEELRDAREAKAEAERQLLSAQQIRADNLLAAANQEDVEVHILASQKLFACFKAEVDRLGQAQLEAEEVLRESKANAEAQLRAAQEETNRAEEKYREAKQELDRAGALYDSLAENMQALKRELAGAQQAKADAEAQLLEARTLGETEMKALQVSQAQLEVELQLAQQEKAEAQMHLVAAKRAREEAEGWVQKQAAEESAAQLARIEAENSLMEAQRIRAEAEAEAQRAQQLKRKAEAEAQASEQVRAEAESLLSCAQQKNKEAECLNQKQDEAELWVRQAKADAEAQQAQFNEAQQAREEAEAQLRSTTQAKEEAERQLSLAQQLRDTAQADAERLLQQAKAESDNLLQLAQKVKAEADAKLQLERSAAAEERAAAEECKRESEVQRMAVQQLRLELERLAKSMATEEILAKKSRDEAEANLQAVQQEKEAAQVQAQEIQRVALETKEQAEKQLSDAKKLREQAEIETAAWKADIEAQQKAALQSREEVECELQKAQQAEKQIAELKNQLQEALLSKLEIESQLRQMKKALETEQQSRSQEEADKLSKELNDLEQSKALVASQQTRIDEELSFAQKAKIEVELELRAAQQAKTEAAAVLASAQQIKTQAELLAKAKSRRSDGSYASGTRSTSGGASRLGTTPTCLRELKAGKKKLEEFSACQNSQDDMSSMDSPSVMQFSINRNTAIIPSDNGAVQGSWSGGKSNQSLRISQVSPESSEKLIRQRVLSSPDSTGSNELRLLKRTQSVWSTGTWHGNAGYNQGDERGRLRAVTQETLQQLIPQRPRSVGAATRLSEGHGALASSRRRFSLTPGSQTSHGWFAAGEGSFTQSHPFEVMSGLELMPPQRSLSAGKADTYLQTPGSSRLMRDRVRDYWIAQPIEPQRSVANPAKMTVPS